MAVTKKAAAPKVAKKAVEKKAPAAKPTRKTHTGPTVVVKTSALTNWHHAKDQGNDARTWASQNR